MEPLRTVTVDMGRVKEFSVPVYPLEALIEGGLIWLLNVACLQPRGYSLRLHYDGGRCIGWSIFGDGGEPHHILADSVDQQRFDAVAALLRSADERWSRRSHT